jgi:TolB-like protein
MTSFFAELKRRQMFRVAAAYAVVAWVLLQVVNNVAPALMLPNWAATLVLVLLAIGFPVALLFCWIQQLAPAGGDSKATTGRLDWVLISALIVVIGLVSYQQLAPNGATTAQPQTGVEAAKAAAASPAGAISLAVLPFANMSGDASQEFFSDGITEEITSALVKIPDLRVVARTSAFEFKGQNRNIQNIGQQLNASHLIEGSVRKQGERVRITVQLIKAADGTHVWSENYDRQLTDIFAIQEEIARSIATSFNMRLGVAPGQNLVSDRPKDQETYELYLRGVAALRTRSRQELELLEQVVARDPNYAPGWAKLGEARREMALYYERRGEVSKRGPLVEGAEAAARKAIALAPGSAGGYGVLGAIAFWRGKWAEAMDFYKEALARDPDDPEVLTTYAAALRNVGYLKESLVVRERQNLLEPLVPLYNRLRAEILLANARPDDAIPSLVKFRQDGVLAMAYAGQGRFSEAADLYDKFLSGSTVSTSGDFARPLVEAAGQVLRAAANKAEPPAQLPDFYSELNFVYAYTSTPERMLDWYEKAMKEGDYRPLGFVWWPTPSSVRKTERFKTFVRDAGLVDYWRARGWPDLCKPVGANDFTCE